MDTAVPIVCEGPVEDAITKPFNTALIYLNAKLDSDLDWSRAQKEAKLAIENQKQILWDIDLGLFTELPLPLSDTTQYKSLHLALDHFFESLFKEFKDHSIGAILFKGTLDLASKWVWDPDQIASLRDSLTSDFSDAQSFHNKSNLTLKTLLDAHPKELKGNTFGENYLRHLCLKAALDYFEILSARFPSDLLPYVCFDASHITSITHQMQLLDQEPFEFIQLAIKGTKVHFPSAIGWESHAYPNGFIGKEAWEHKMGPMEPNFGILIPENKIYDPQVLKAYDQVIDELLLNKQVKFLFERSLAVDWEGLDYLLIFECEDLTKRKLEGFIAAGGEVITYHDLGLSKETLFHQYKQNGETS